MRTVLLAALCGGLAVWAPARAAGDRPTEYDVKAAFVYHFAHLVEWPAEGSGDGRPFTIAVVRHPPFAEALERVVSGRHLRDRPVRVLRYASVHHVRGRPQILVSGARTRAEVRDTASVFAGEPVLTVGDAQHFAESGGIIGFRITSEGRVAFDINVEHAQRAGLRISSQLLKLARIVR